MLDLSGRNFGGVSLRSDGKPGRGYALHYLNPYEQNLTIYSYVSLKEGIKFEIGEFISEFL
jgi:hypothetical protein